MMMVGQDGLVRRTARSPARTKGSHNKGITQNRPTVPMQLAASKSVRGWEEGEGVQAAILNADPCMCVCVRVWKREGEGRRRPPREIAYACACAPVSLDGLVPACRPFRLAMTPATATCLCSL